MMDGGCCCCDDFDGGCDDDDCCCDGRQWDCDDNAGASAAELSPTLEEDAGATMALLDFLLLLASRCCPPCWDERQRLWKRLWRERRSRLPRWHPPSSPCHPRPFPSCAALNSSRTMLRRYERHLAPSPYCFWICHPLLHPWRSSKRRLPPSADWKLPPMALHRCSRPGMLTKVPTPAVSAASQSSLSKRRKRTMRYPAAEWHDAPFNIVRCAPLPISLDDSCCLLGGPV